WEGLCRDLPYFEERGRFAYQPCHAFMIDGTRRRSSALTRRYPWRRLCSANLLDRDRGPGLLHLHLVHSTWTDQFPAERYRGLTDRFRTPLLKNIHLGADPQRSRIMFHRLTQLKRVLA